MDIMVGVSEIEKVTACEDNFWERDIHYVIKNNGIQTLIFYFDYSVMNVNFVLSILFLVMIEICFGLSFHNAQLCVVSFCFGYFWAREDLYKFMLKKTIAYVG